MAAPRLELNGQHFRLVEKGKATFVLDDPRALPGSGSGPACEFVVCLSAGNAEARIVPELDQLRASLAGCNWRLIAADNGSTDSTRERLNDWCDRASVRFARLDFKHEPAPHLALARVEALGRVYANTDCRVLSVSIENPPRPHRIGAFAVVVTRELKKEAAIMVRSLRAFHPEPIFVTCDRETKIFLQKQGDTGLEFSEGVSKAKLAKLATACRGKVSIGNDFHRVDCIAAKMDAWQWAISETGAAMFLDADIVAVGNLNEGFASELALSPHWHGSNEPETARKFGLFNAGYLWTCNPEAPEFWREIYLGRSAFFEQEGMNLFIERFPFDLFPRAHNVGFWREPEFDINGVKSYHVHMTDALDAAANSGLRAKYLEHRERVTAALEILGRFDLVEFIRAL